MMAALPKREPFSGERFFSFNKGRWLCRALNRKRTTSFAGKGSDYDRGLAW